MMMNELEERNLTVLTFKKKYPRQYKYLLEYYGGIRIFDKAAAVCLYLRGAKPPTCAICNKPLGVDKQLRNVSYTPRCKSHLNTKPENIVTREILEANNPHGYTIVDVPQYASPSTYIKLHCHNHGDFSQPAANFLAGMRCNKCYDRTEMPPRVDYATWLARSKEYFGDYYDYSKVQFDKVEKDIITIICPVHGEFTQVASTHMRGHGCKKCANALSSTNLTRSTAEFIRLANIKHSGKYQYPNTIYNGSRSIVEIECPIHGPFNQVAYYHLAGNGCQQCGYETTTSRSAAEKELVTWLEDSGISNVTYSNRIFSYELDVYLPDYNIAIEYNGLHWHSSNSKDLDWKYKSAHLYKTTECESRGIQLFHINESEWGLNATKKEIWKSIILENLQVAPTILKITDCDIIIVDSSTAIEFMEENHIYGYFPGSSHIGLERDGVLVALATFAKSNDRNAKPNTYELVRYATLIYTSIPSAFSVILSHFTQDKTGALIAYADRRFDNGALFESNGFVLDSIEKPTYQYIKGQKTYHRCKFTKSIAENTLPIFDKSKTLVENMYDNKYRRMWDCGQLIYILQF